MQGRQVAAGPTLWAHRSGASLTLEDDESQPATARSEADRAVHPSLGHPPELGPASDEVLADARLLGLPALDYVAAQGVGRGVRQARRDSNRLDATDRPDDRTGGPALPLTA